MQVAAVVGVPAFVEMLGKRKYAEVKESEALKPRKKVKQDVQNVLEGWVRNTGDEDFELNK